MNRDAVGAIGEWVGAISVVATLAYLARQMRLNTRQLKRAEQNTTMEQYSALRHAVAGDAELARLMLAAETDFPSLDAVGRYRVEQLFLDWIFAHFNLRDRIHKGDVDVKWEEVALGVARRLRTSVGRELWPRFRIGVHADFREVMDRLPRSRRASRALDQRASRVTASTARRNEAG